MHWSLRAKRGNQTAHLKSTPYGSLRPATVRSRLKAPLLAMMN